MRPFGNSDVERVFKGYPPLVRKHLLGLRELILETAQRTPGVGAIEETLKWGEPAYVTSQTGSGSTLRIDWKQKQPDQFAMYFHCKTNLVESFRTMFPNDFQFEGNRALVFKVGAAVPEDALAVCVSASLTYHLRKGTAQDATLHRTSSPSRIEAVQKPRRLR